MHLLDAKRFIKIQVVKLCNEHELNSKQIADYLNRVNPYKYRVKSGVSIFYLLISDLINNLFLFFFLKEY